jgi:hypothetical protein
MNAGIHSKDMPQKLSCAVADFQTCPRVAVRALLVGVAPLCAPAQVCVEEFFGSIKITDVNGKSPIKKRMRMLTRLIFVSRLVDTCCRFARDRVTSYVTWTTESLTQST